jgi:hypothetical protein
MKDLDVIIGRVTFRSSNGDYYPPVSTNRLRPSFARRLRDRMPSTPSPRRSAFWWFVALLVSSAAFIAWKTRSGSPTRLPYRSVLELRGVRVAAITLANGSTLDLTADAKPHVVYVFASSCVTCDRQRAHLAGLLGAVPNSQLVSAAPDPIDSIADYWAEAGATFAPPLSVDSGWLRRANLADVPLLLFVSPGGRISRAVHGSILSWSAQTVINELRRAAVADQRFASGREASDPP